MSTVQLLYASFYDAKNVHLNGIYGIYYNANAITPYDEARDA
jgi:hypothetical protein